MGRLAGVVVLVAALVPLPARAVPLEALDVARDWRLGALRFAGNHALPSRLLRRAMVTTVNPWFTIWRRPPLFDPVAFRTDLERLQQFYRTHGYYTARIAPDVELPARGDVLTAVVYVEEGPPVFVERVDVALGGEALPEAERATLLDHLPIARGQVFTQESYDRAFTTLRTYYREHGYARVRVTKQAEVDVERNAAGVTYAVDSGPPCVFGEVQVEGTHAVDPAIVRRELPFDPGDPFRQSRLERARANLTALNLFSTIRIDEDPSRDPAVGVRVRVTEAPPHEIRLGVGYDTEEEVRGLASWRDYNFLGDARQLGFTARASAIRRTATADFLQPHFPGENQRTRLLAAEEQEEEDAFTLDRSRLSPRLEWQATREVTGFAFYRFEYDSLSSVRPAVRRLLPGVAPPNAFLSGLGFGFDWNTTDDLLDPSHGWVSSLTVEPVGDFLGGDVGFVRLIGDGRFYQPLAGRFLGAARLRLGTAEVTGGTGEVPLYERFYAGGLNSVRGYGRRRIGPLVHDEPVGGRSLVEGSLELRHPITEQFGAAVFLDAGQVALASNDFPFGDLRYGSGFGVRYRSPVGPLRLDLGFPVQPPAGDSRWQVHVSIGATF